MLGNRLEERGHGARQGWDVRGSRSEGSQELGTWCLGFLFWRRAHRGLQASGSGWGRSRTDVFLVARFGDGFQQWVPGARLLPLLGLTRLGVGDPEARIDATLHVILGILWR